jgi:hypothetical protein
MTKYSAFGAELKVGVRQVETATVVGTITLLGNATVIVTATGMTGTPITTNVGVLLNDTADTVAEKIRVALRAVANITAMFDVLGSGPFVQLRRKIAAADIANLNISIANGTCTGLTDDTTSDATTSGVVSTTIAQVKNIGGPSLSLDTEDVTTHDQTGAWEEVIATILRSGEVSLDLVYDPAGATHSAGAGLLDWYENKTNVYCDLVFRSTYNWMFGGYVTGFEPSASFDSSLSAAVTLKIAEPPILE